MSILINGMEMPTNCGDCYFEQIGAEEDAEEDVYGDTCISYCLLTEWRIALSNRDDMKLPSCPLIEIVTCGECKYSGESLLYPIEMVCKYHLGHTYYTEADRFCYFGERRSE